MRDRPNSSTGLSLVEMIAVLAIIALLIGLTIVPLSHRSRSQRVTLYNIETALRTMEANDCYQISAQKNPLLLIVNKRGHIITRIRLSGIKTYGERHGCRLPSTRALIHPVSKMAISGTCFAGTTPAAGKTVCINAFSVVFRLNPGEKFLRLKPISPSPIRGNDHPFETPELFTPN